MLVYKKISCKKVIDIKVRGGWSFLHLLLLMYCVQKLPLSLTFSSTLFATFSGDLLIFVVDLLIRMLIFFRHYFA